MRAAAAAACVLAIVLSNVAASAKEPTPDEVDRARTFFNAGAQAYASARYIEAARSFERAYELAPRPQLLFSLAQAERKEFFTESDATFGRRAVLHYKLYLDQVPAGGRRNEAREAKADVEARLSRLDPQQTAQPLAADTRKARVTVYSATPTAHVSIDNGPPQELPYFGDLAPGKHRVRVSAEGYFDAEREVSGDKPIDQPVDLPLKERPCSVTVVLASAADILVDGHVVATAPLSQPIDVPPGAHVLGVVANGRKPFAREVVLPRGKPFRFEPVLEASGQRVVAVTMVGVGVAGIVAGGVFGVLALANEGRAKNTKDDLEKGNISGERLDDYNSSLVRRDLSKNVSIIAVSAGAAFLTGGALLYFFDRPTVSVLPPRSVEPTPPPRNNPPLDITASPFVGPGGSWGGSMRLTF